MPGDEFEAEEHIEAEMPDDVEDDGPFVVLKKPIMAHGNKVSRLEFREPNGEDITHCGYPFRIADGEATPIAGAFSKYISRLAGIPKSSVFKLSAPDYQACIGKIGAFFD